MTNNIQTPPWEKWCAALRLAGFLVLVLALLAPALQAQPPGFRPSKRELNPRDYGIRSKKALQAYLDGMAAANFGGWRQALEYYEQALDKEPVFVHALYQKGVALMKIGLGDSSLALFKKVVRQDPNGPWLSYYHLGQLMMLKGDYANAAEYLNKFLERAKGNYAEERKKAGNMVQKAEFAAEGVKNPVKFEPENLGANINSEGEEYMPYLTADDRMIFYTSRRAGNLGPYDQMLGSYREDFYVSTRQEDGSWSPARNLGAPINTPENEGSSCISPDGQYVFFTACNRMDGFGSCDLYVARYSGEKWTEPVNMGNTVNSGGWESHPCISHDGKRLYFCSVRPGGLGGHDIWYTDYVDGKWQEPVNMGEPINTPGDEYYPFLHADGRTFYFSSDHHLGYGGIDLFRSRLEGYEWSEPENLGFPINSPRDEHGIFVNAAGTHGYFNSNRFKSGQGGDDLYMFALDERLKPDFTTYVRGKITDSLSGERLLSTVQFIDVQEEDTIREVRTNKLGEFMLTLPLDHNYAAYVEKEGYLFYSANFSLKGLEDVRYYDLDIKLQPVQEGAVIQLENIFFDLDQYSLKPESIVELQRLLKFMQKNPNMRVELSGHTDSQASEEYNITLSQNRAQAVKEWLIERGIAADRLESKGYGEGQPIATNETPEGRALNRRTELKILSL